MVNIISALIRVLNHPLNKSQKAKSLIKVIWWLINRKFFNQPIITEIAPGARLICEPNSSYGSLTFYTKLPEFAEQMFMYKITHPDNIIFDIGAHIGSETILLGSRLRKGKIYSFEPTPDVYKKLLENIRLNNLQNTVISESIAISDKIGSIKFFLSTESEINSLIPTYSLPHIKVNTTTIDNYCLNNNIKHINLLKIDVEGAEQKVLSGAAIMLKKYQIDIVLFEINDRNGISEKSNEQLLEFLSTLKYKLFNIDNDLHLSKYIKIKSVHNCIAISPKINIKKIEKLLRE